MPIIDIEGIYINTASNYGNYFDAVFILSRYTRVKTWHIDTVELIFTWFVVRSIKYKYIQKGKERKVVKFCHESNHLAIIPLTTTISQFHTHEEV